MQWLKLMSSSILSVLYVEVANTLVLFSLCALKAQGQIAITFSPQETLLVICVW